MALLARTLNAVALLAICILLLVAFYWQLARHELPCPLCLLQRAALIGAGLGLMLNVRFGASESHYGVAIISALAGAAFAARQILLHIVPGAGGYGAVLYGYHFYTWALVIFFLIALFSAALLLIEAQFVEGVRDWRPTTAAQILGWLFVALALANAVSTLLLCGFGPCPDNPTGYELLQR
ncbi:MAG TPA: disulfide bond formation protein B [Burkholderiales bacterium]|nr:disulfide bond formation protein B [Burkholderiales bacterium]